MSTSHLLESGESSYSVPAKAVLSLNSPSPSSCQCVGDECSCTSGTVLSTPLLPRRASYGSCRPASGSNEPHQSLRCHCHVEAPKKVDKTARNKLLIACGIALVFTIGEAVGEPHSLSLTHHTLSLSLQEGILLAV